MLVLYKKVVTCRLNQRLPPSCHEKENHTPIRPFASSPCLTFSRAEPYKKIVTEYNLPTATVSSHGFFLGNDPLKDYFHCIKPQAFALKLRPAKEPGVWSEQQRYNEPSLMIATRMEFLILCIK